MHVHVRDGLSACLCVLALLLAARPARAQSEEYVEYSGTASARHKPELLYREHHFLLYRDAHLVERTVLYLCGNDQPFARKRVTYLQEEAPDFYFDDASNGMREGIASQGTTRTMFFKANAAAIEKRVPLPQVSSLVADAGFDNFIPAHWNALMSGATVSFPFLVISRLQVMNFEVQLLRADRFEGRATAVFRMKLSGIVGLLFSGIEVTYDAADRHLVRYEGLSDLRDASGDNLQADIVFLPVDRKPSSAQALLAAQSAALAPCR